MVLQPMAVAERFCLKPLTERGGIDSYVSKTERLPIVEDMTVGSGIVITEVVGCEGEIEDWGEGLIDAVVNKGFPCFKECIVGSEVGLDNGQVIIAFDGGYRRVIVSDGLLNRGWFVLGEGRVVVGRDVVFLRSFVF